MLKNNYPWYQIKLLAVVLTALGLWAIPGQARNVSSATSSLPAGVMYPTPMGIVFPGFNSAAGVNAAALAIGKRATSIQLTASPELTAGDGNSGTFSIANSGSMVGWALGYSGNITNRAHGLYGGFAGKISRVSLGVGLRDSDLGGTGLNPSVDVGSKVDLGKDFSFAAVAYDLDTQTRTYAAGIGYGRSKKESVEINGIMPPSGGNYGVTFAATVYSGIFGTSFRSTYYIQNQNFSHTLGGMVWFKNDMNFLIQLSSPKQLVVGVTWVF